MEGNAFGDSPIPGPETRPITEQPIIDHEEIRTTVAELVENYGDDKPELIRRFTEYMILSLIEVVTIKTAEPRRIERLPDEMIETVRNLADGLPGSESKDV